MAIGDRIKGTDRKVLNVAIVAVLIALTSGIAFVLTGWQIAKTAAAIAIPVGVVAVFVALVRVWWPRNEA